MITSRTMPALLAVSIALAGLAWRPATASPEGAAGGHEEPTAPTPGGAPVMVAVSMGNFAMVERAPVRNGFGPFTIEATGLLPMPRKLDDVTPSEDDHFYTLRRTVKRFLKREEVPVGWSGSNEAAIAFNAEVSHLRKAADGIAYAVEGEMVVRGTSPLPLGLSIRAPADAPPLRYSAGLMVADQTVMMVEGMLEAGKAGASYMAAVRPSGEDAAAPVRAVFAVRAEGPDPDANRKALAEVKAVLTASADGRAAIAERAQDASEWLKPLPVYVRPGEVAGEKGEAGGKEKRGKKAERKAEGGGHH